MEGITIRLLRDEDIDQLNNLYNQTYHLHRTREKFLWEFVMGPVGPAIYVVAKDETLNKIVGTQCAIPLYLNSSNGKRILTAKSEDTLVDSAYRGQRIFEKMYQLLFDECSKAGIQYLWGFTYAVKPFKKIGFEIPFDCNFGLVGCKPLPSYRYLNSLNANRSLTDKVKICGFLTLSYLKYLTRSLSIPKMDGYTISTNPQNELNAIQANQSEDYFYLNQDEEFLHWRLETNPYPNKHLFYSLIDSAGEMKGSIVCSLHPEGIGYIMQSAFSKPLKSMAVTFTKYVIKDLSKKAGLIRFWGFENNHAGRNQIELMKDAGMMFTGMGISFVWKHLYGSDEIDPARLILSRMAAQGS